VQRPHVGRRRRQVANRSPRDRSLHPYWSLAYP